MKATGIVGAAMKKILALLNFAGIAVAPVNKVEQDFKMKWFFNALITVVGLIATISAYAGVVKIVDVEVTCNNSCTFAVTLKHQDEGWEHYANQWDVITTDGQLLKTRVLYHPHVDEQPFTRSMSGVTIPPGTSAVKVRAKDSKHGYSSEEYTVQIPAAIQ